MKATHKPVTVEAVQWFKPGDYHLESVRHPEIWFDTPREYFYIRHSDFEAGDFKDHGWLAVDENSEAAKTHGLERTFAEHDSRPFHIHPLSEYPELAARFVSVKKLPFLPRICVHIPCDSDGMVYTVVPGMWIVYNPFEGRRCYRDSFFKQQFDLVDA